MWKELCYRNAFSSKYAVVKKWEKKYGGLKYEDSYGKFSRLTNNSQNTI